MRADIHQRAGAMQQAMEIFLIHDEFFPFLLPLRLSFPKQASGNETCQAVFVSLSTPLAPSASMRQCWMIS
jgi:hypothetical protein